MSILTLTLAIALRKTRESSLLTTRIRTEIANYGVVLAILISVSVDYFHTMKYDTPKLQVPTEIVVTNPKRKWFINPGFKILEISLAIPTAFLAVILIVLDQQITAVIVNRKDNKLKKGEGYHLDLLVVAFLILVCGFFGLPWYIAATVQSITHINSLKKFSIEGENVPGVLPSFSGVIEQRVTGILIYTFVGLSVFMAPYMQLIPMPVLYGVFIYIGIFGLVGQQLVERVMDEFNKKKHGKKILSTHFLRNF